MSFGGMKRQQFLFCGYCGYVLAKLLKNSGALRVIPVRYPRIPQTTGRRKTIGCSLNGTQSNRLAARDSSATLIRSDVHPPPPN
jgi:hypothetical protein